MFVEFILVSSWIFWGLFLGLILLEGWLVNDDAGTFAIFIAAVAIAGMFGFTDAFRNVTLAGAALYAVGWVAIGVGWSFRKWIALNYKQAEEAKATWLKYGYDKTPGAKTLSEFAKDYRPVVSQNKERLITWTVLWPVSVFWDVLTWPRRFFVWLFEHLRTSYERVSERIWNKIFNS